MAKKKARKKASTGKDIIGTRMASAKDTELAQVASRLSKKYGGNPSAILRSLTKQRATSAAKKKAQSKRRK